MLLFRERLLARLVERHAISAELAAKVAAWRHPGFSAHVGEAIPPDDRKALEDLAGYVVRNPLSLKRLVYLDGQQAVALLRSLREPRARRARQGGAEGARRHAAPEAALLGELGALDYAGYRIMPRSEGCHLLRA